VLKKLRSKRLAPVLIKVGELAWPWGGVERGEAWPQEGVAAGGRELEGALGVGRVDV
jgi:hypothetical protein